MAISSVLSSFIFNLLLPIHSATSSIHPFKQQEELESQKEHLICEAGNHLQKNDMKDQIDKEEYLKDVYTELIEEVPEQNPAAFHISEQIGLIHDQQTQTGYGNLNRR